MTYVCKKLTKNIKTLKNIYITSYYNEYEKKIVTTMIRLDGRTIFIEKACESNPHPFNSYYRLYVVI